MKTRRDIEDLKIRIVENRTDLEFVISDDPGVMMNRYAAQRLKGNFGISSSGVTFVMPLTPRFAVLCYDGLVSGSVPAACQWRGASGYRAHLCRPSGDHRAHVGDRWQPFRRRKRRRRVTAKPSRRQRR
jgi:hypothetical protein